MANNKYSPQDYAKVDELFHSMSLHDIHELDYVKMSKDTLRRRRKALGIEPFRYPRRSRRLTTRQIDVMIRNMGGVINHD